jgi:hypothetical protein
MKWPPLLRCFGVLLSWCDNLTFQLCGSRSVLWLAGWCLLTVPSDVHAQFSLPKTRLTRSVSGQFIVSGTGQVSSLANSAGVATDTNFVRLDPTLLAVSAERIKQLLRRKLDIPPQVPWQGEIYLVLHPARSLDENVTITSGRFLDGWDYRVQLPDVVSRTRYVRAMVATLLLNFANRGAGEHSAEIPDWLTDGLSLQLLAENPMEVILSMPSKIVNGLPENSSVTVKRGLDSLAGPQRTLRNLPALTFQQLSWPTSAQLLGEDGGDYRASAQLFVAKLLDLKNGPARLRLMLQKLPHFYNWQLAFQSAFHENFSSPLDVEKWWALQVVSLEAHNPGPQWTPAVSRAKLDQILSVPVDIHSSSNAMPTHADISYQDAIRDFTPAQRTAVFQIKLRDLQLAQLRMAPQLAALTAEYRRVVDGYLGEHSNIVHAPRFSRRSMSQGTSARETVKKLDALDVRRNAIEARIKPDMWARQN